VRLERQEARGNGVAQMEGFGIIREAALYQGHGPVTILKFKELWSEEGLPEIGKLPSALKQSVVARQRLFE
jgi:hypothetical protein